MTHSKNDMNQISGGWKCRRCGKESGAANKGQAAAFMGSCEATEKPAAQPMATEKQVKFLRFLINDDYSQATTFGLDKADLSSMTKSEASRAIDHMQS